MAKNEAVVIAALIGAIATTVAFTIGAGLGRQAGERAATQTMWQEAIANGHAERVILDQVTGEQEIRWLEP